MKFIRKGRPPSALGKFARENVDTPDLLRFAALPAAVKQTLQKRLLEEQGRLCAYTMHRIGRPGAASGSDYHIEHIRPQSRHPNRELDYANVVLCAPGADRAHCEWGARHKDHAEVDEHNFVSPLKSDCETRLTYDAEGAVRETDPRDEAAARTVALLNLNHRELVELRRSAMRALGLTADAPRPISAATAARLVDGILTPGRDGGLQPFCIAIAQVAARVAAKARARAARLANDH